MRKALPLLLALALAAPAAALENGFQWYAGPTPLVAANGVNAELWTARRVHFARLGLSLFDINGQRVGFDPDARHLEDVEGIELSPYYPLTSFREELESLFRHKVKVGITIHLHYGGDLVRKNGKFLGGTGYHGLEPAGGPSALAFLQDLITWWKATYPGRAPIFVQWGNEYMVFKSRDLDTWAELLPVYQAYEADFIQARAMVRAAWGNAKVYTGGHRSVVDQNGHQSLNAYLSERIKAGHIPRRATRHDLHANGVADPAQVAAEIWALRNVAGVQVDVLEDGYMVSQAGNIIAATLARIEALKGAKVKLWATFAGDQPTHRWGLNTFGKNDISTLAPAHPDLLWNAVPASAFHAVAVELGNYRPNFQPGAGPGDTLTPEQRAEAADIATVLEGNARVQLEAAARIRAATTKAALEPEAIELTHKGNRVHRAAADLAGITGQFTEPRDTRPIPKDVAP